MYPNGSGYKTKHIASYRSLYKHPIAKPAQSNYLDKNKQLQLTNAVLLVHEVYVLMHAF